MNQTSGENPLDPAAAQVIQKARRLMLIASLTTLIALAAVLVVIGYRVSRVGGSTPPPPPDVSALLPSGARVISTAIGEGRLAVTIEAGGAQEVRLFDLHTLQPVGRIALTPKP
ncbi:MAG: hypothetical protein WA792_16385 [Pseudolabrys sp.]